MKRVLLLIPKGAEVFETAAFFDVLGWAAAEGSTPIEVVTVGLSRQVRCTFGLTIVPDRLIDEVDPSEFDALAVPGGFEEHGYYEEAYSPAVGHLIGAFDRLERPIASICVGALPVAASGALDGRCATTYHLDGSPRRKQLAEYDVTVIDRPIVRDGHIITSTDPSTAIDVALALLEDLTDRANAERIRMLMGFGPSTEPRPTTTE
jgi:4-methyl-5(b-hydroxyethyl)-thiazole monophosphate biosynthesis